MFISTFLITTITVVGVFLLIAYLRRGTVASVTIGARVLSFESERAPTEVFGHLVNGAGKFAHADSDTQARMIVLETKPTFATWGFFYPVEITERPGGGSVVRIGIRSRVIQWGPLVTKWHRQCKMACERAVNAELPKARVVV